jgi:hypothetical protein
VRSVLRALDEPFEREYGGELVSLVVRQSA